MTQKEKSLSTWDLGHFKVYNAIYDYLKEKNMLKDGLKLFNVYPNDYNVETEEKFNFYKMFFEKIKDEFYKNEYIYTDFEKVFAKSLLKAKDFNDYKNNCNKMVRIFKLIDRKHNF